MKHKIGNWGAGLLLAGWSLVASATFTAQVDHTQVSMNDLVTLTVRLSNESTNASPDFSGLNNDFSVVQQSGPNQSSEFTFINGQQSSETHTDWTFVLQPKHTGQLTIPAFQLGSASTQPITVNVVPGSSGITRPINRYVFFETSVDHDQVYVQGQVIYTIKLYYANSISGDFPPPPTVDNAVVEIVQKEKRYESMVANRRYYVLEKSYAIYPQQSGTIVIPSQRFNGTRGSSSFFSPTQPVSAVSRQHTIKVLPKPASFTDPNWLPAQSITLTESWGSQPPKFRVGEPINRILTLTAKGIASSLLPSFPTLNLSDAKTYADPPDTTDQPSERYGIVSTQSTTIGIVPTKPGKLTLPEIRIPWWNTKTNKMEVAVIPAETYTISATPGSSVTIPQAPPTPGATATKQEQSQTVITYVPSRIWMYVLGAMLLLWLFSTWQWLSTRRRLQRLENSTGTEPVPPPSHGMSEADAWEQFRRACKDGDAVRASKALFVWGSTRYPSVYSLQDLGRLGDESLTREISALEIALYASDGSTPWQGDALLTAAKALHDAHVEKPKHSALASTLNP